MISSSRLHSFNCLFRQAERRAKAAARKAEEEASGVSSSSAPEPVTADVVVSSRVGCISLNFVVTLIMNHIPRVWHLYSPFS